MNQALKAMALTGQSHEVKEKVLKELMNKLSGIDLSKKPPEFARLIYNLVSETTGNKDPYKEIKERDNNHALGLLPEIKKIIEKSDDKLITTLKIAAAANIMDFAANANYDLKKTVENALSSNFAINDYKKFKDDIKKAKSIAYLADNCGEIVFDKLLMENIKQLNDCKIYLFVKGKPIVNDATKSDISLIGIDKIAGIEIMTIDTGFPNAGLRKESSEFNEFINNVDVVISKGQGNYESLSESNANIYFLLIAKCPIVARDLNIKKGNIILKFNKTEVG